MPRALRTAAAAGALPLPCCLVLPQGYPLVTTPEQLTDTALVEAKYRWVGVGTAAAAVTVGRSGHPALAQLHHSLHAIASYPPSLLP